MPAVRNLPDELITIAFSYLLFDQLLVAAQVCQRWRDLGIEHTTFWKYIHCTSASPGSVELLKARLGQSDGRPFRLLIDIHGCHPLIGPVMLLDYVNRMLPYAEILSLRLEHWYLPEIWSVLNNAAPALVSLELKLYSPDRVLPRIPLPTWILNCTPGKLGLVHITDIIIPYPPITAAFANVVTVYYTQSQGATLRFFYFDFLDVFPNLKKLYLETGYLTWEKPPWYCEAKRNSLQCLEVLDLCFQRASTEEFLTQIPIADIPHVLITASQGLDFDRTYDFLDAVRSPFNFSVLSITPTEFWIVIEEARSNYQRIFADAIKNYIQAAPDAPDEFPLANPIFENEEFPAQVECLGVSASLWQTIIPHLQHFRTVTKLVVDLNTLSSELPCTPFSLPMLDSLVLDAREVMVHIRASDLLAFVALLTADMLSLELRGVTIEGYELLAERFNPVTSTNSRLFTYARHGIQRRTKVFAY